MNSRSSEKEVFWREILGQFEKSQVPVRQFCVDRQIAENSFYHWRREIARRDAETDQKLQTRNAHPQVTKASKAHAPQMARHQVAAQTLPSDIPHGDISSPFIPVQLSDRESCLELLHPGGYQLRISEGFNSGLLREVLNVLDQQSSSGQLDA